MPKKSPPQFNLDMPEELNALRALVTEFISRCQNIDNEIDALKEDRKSLVEEFSEKLDIKTLNLALKVIKIESSVAHKHVYDLFSEVLRDPTT